MANRNLGETTKSSRWRFLNLVRPERASSKDAIVREWKQAWTQGAHARWSGDAPTNPHQSGSAREAAWSAGWHWAERQRDRRHPEVVRFAHPLRRNTDTTGRLIRTAQAGAVGLSVVTLIGWVWQMRRRKVS